MKKLILGSGSPRRAQLLKEMGFEFDIRKSDADETIPPTISPKNAAEYLAKVKSDAIEIGPNEVLLTADTIVICDEEVLAKPENSNHAREMLEKLSSKSHLVISGVCIRSSEKKFSFSNTTQVNFKQLSHTEIDRYVDIFHPMDKAGAYGIQEWIGLVGVKEIKGSYFNVVGLPCDQVYAALTSEFGLAISK